MIPWKLTDVVLECISLKTSTTMWSPAQATMVGPGIVLWSSFIDLTNCFIVFIETNTFSMILNWKYHKFIIKMLARVKSFQNISHSCLPVYANYSFSKSISVDTLRAETIFNGFAILSWAFMASLFHLRLLVIYILSWCLALITCWWIKWVLDNQLPCPWLYKTRYEVRNNKSLGPHLFCKHGRIHVFQANVQNYLSLFLFRKLHSDHFDSQRLHLQK